MSKLNPIATNCNFSSASFYPTIVGSFYNLSCESSALFYTTRDHTQLFDCKGFQSRSTPNLARNQPEEILLKTRPNQEFIDRSAITPEKFAATSAFIQDLDFYEQDRAIHHKILAQRERHAPRSDRYRSGQIATVGTRSTQADSYQARSFWQWIEPPPDIPICIPQGAASLQEGGAL